MGDSTDELVFSFVYDKVWRFVSKWSDQFRVWTATLFQIHRGARVQRTIQPSGQEGRHHLTKHELVSFAWESRANLDRLLVV